MQNKCIKKDRREFSGKFIISFAEREKVWAYDEISLGLYLIDLCTKKVEPVLNPMQIHKNKIITIRGIIKQKDKIILVPQMINEFWVSYEINTQNIKYINPIHTVSQIIEVRQNNNIVFLIPFNTKEPIFLLSLEDLSCLKKIEKWFEQDSHIYSTWGSSVDEINIIFPIIGKNYIGRANINNLELIPIDIPYPILSINADKNDMWILPVKGDYIYRTDKSGKVNECIKLDLNFGITADQFTRIINIEEFVFLFPYEGKDIYCYKKREKIFIKVELEAISCWSKLLIQLNCSYWDYYVNNNILHILPMRYKYFAINLSTLEVFDEDKLVYGLSCCERVYRDWCLWSIEKDANKLLLEKKDVLLDDLIEFISITTEDKSVKNYKLKTGEKVLRYLK